VGFFLVLAVVHGYPFTLLKFCFKSAHAALTMRKTTGRLHFDVNLIEVLAEVVLVCEADPENVVRVEVHKQFNKLTVNAIEHYAVVVVV
jgi:hypothetical protein